jgi:hypothetical protein
MATQSLLAKNGMRSSTLGSSASLAIAMPIAEGSQDNAAMTAANRTGWYGNQTSGSELIGMVVGGVTGPTVTHLGTGVQLALTAGVIGGAPLNLPQGVAPTAPNNGDLWTTSAGVFARINGVTYNMTAGGGTIGGSIAATQIAFGSGPNAIQGDASLTYSVSGGLSCTSAGGATFNNGITSGTTVVAASDIDGGGNLNITNDGNIGGALAVTGAITSGSTITSTSDITDGGNLFISGTTFGNASFWGGNMSVTGTTTLGVVNVGSNLSMPAVAPAATTGYFAITSTTGVPTGVPSNPTGIPMVFDTGNDDLYAYYGGAWNVIAGSSATIGGSIAANQVAVGSGVNTISGSAGLTVSTTGTLIVSPAAAIGAVAEAFEVIGAANTQNIATANIPDVIFALARTVQWATGTVAQQDAVRITAPTYSAVGASTFTSASTVTITGAPAAGTNATITNPYAMWIQAGTVTIGNAAIATSATTGFLSIPSCAGTPTGTPANGTSSVPLVYNSTNELLYAYTSGNWITIGGPVAADQIAFGAGQNQITGSSTLTYAPTAGMEIAPTATTSVGQTAFTLVGAANTNNNTTEEWQDVYFNLARTVQWATGTITTQRAFEISAPTYAFVGASTITTAATVAITAAPAAGTNATITNPYALWVQAGTVTIGTAALGTTATTGFLVIPSCAGVPTGTPANGTSSVPLVYNTTGSALYAYTGGAWAAVGGGGGGTIGGSIASGQVAFGSGSNTIQGSATLTYGATTGLALAPTAVATGIQTALTLTTAANTNQTAATEANGIILNCSATKQWATGSPIATQREILIQAPTYAFVGGSIITKAATLAITGAPIAGTNATLSTSLAFWVQGGGTELDGTLTVLPTTSSATQLALNVTQPANTGGTPNALKVTGGAHTTLAATVNAPDVNLVLNRTVQFATGGLLLQTAFFINAPTYAFVAGSTLTNAATVYIDGAPAAGTNATITSSWSLMINAGNINLGPGNITQTGNFINPVNIVTTGQAALLLLNAPTGFVPIIRFDINSSIVNDIRAAGGGTLQLYDMANSGVIVLQYTGGTLAAGFFSFFDTLDATAIGTASVVMSGGLSVAKQLRVGGNLTMSDATNIAVNATTGTKIGTATTQKLGFWNATPVVQPASATGNTHTPTAGSTTSVFTNTTFDGSIGSTAYTIGDIVANLKTAGILAS